MFIIVLIIFFITLIFYQLLFQNNLFKYFSNIESMSSGSSNALILAQENAGNIQVLKQQMDKFLNLKDQVKKMSSDLDTLTEQVNGLSLA
jgi:Tfp pilus assembly protein PilO